MPIGDDQNVVTDTNGSVLDQLYQPQSSAQPRPQDVLSGIGKALGSQDIMSALSGQMTPEEQQMFALGSVPMLLAPEARVLEEAVPFVAKLPKYAEEMFSEGGATVHKLQKAGRYPTYVATSPSGESYQFKDFGKAKQWVAPPEVMRPDPPASPMELPPWEEPIRAFHGSPYDFPAFDISKIGTGEGAQSYGHGLYFAENPQVAETYKPEVVGYATVGGGKFDNKDPVHLAAAAIYDMGGDRQKAVRSYQDYINRTHPLNQHDAPDVLKILQSDREIPEFKLDKGRMYEVDIKADPEHFLDWDKPLSEQPHITKTLGKLSSSEDWANTTGQDIAHMLARDPQGVEKLRQKGIPGIRYLDQGSRNVGKTAEDYKQVIAEEENILERMRKAAPNYAKTVGETQAKAELKRQEDLVARFKAEAKAIPKPTYNYVVFDDKLIDIVKKYGLAGLIAGGASNWSPDQAKAGEVVKLEGKNPYGILGMSGANVEQMAEQNKKNKTRATLMRALGGGADVLPIKPGD